MIPFLRRVRQEWGVLCGHYDLDELRIRVDDLKVAELRSTRVPVILDRQKMAYLKQQVDGGIINLNQAGEVLGMVKEYRDGNTPESLWGIRNG